MTTPAVDYYFAPQSPWTYLDHSRFADMVRAAGAREVHMRISSPPTTGPCHYGIDTPHRSELIAEVLRDRNALYRETFDGVENDYTLKLINKSQETRRFRISLEAEGTGLRGMRDRRQRQDAAPNHSGWRPH